MMLRVRSGPWLGWGACLSLAVSFVACDPKADLETQRPVVDGSTPNGAADAAVDVVDAGEDAAVDAATGVEPLADGGLPDPGVVSLRRLNATQYNNTVRDLLATELQPANEFPADDLLYGFDNIGSALSISTLLMEKYEQAAEALVADLFVRTEDDSYARVMVCDVSSEGDTCAQQILQQFARRAWRRPVTVEEMAPYVALLEESDTAEEGLRLALQGVLLSANFIFRIERDPDPQDPTPHPLSGPELASRLSYLLWNTMPDDALFAAAEQGELTSSAGLNSQLERLLSDAKVAAFVTEMSGLWLQARALPEQQRDAEVFPQWSSALRQAMRGETDSFLWELFRRDRPLAELLTADFVMLNEPIAALYGVEGITGNVFQRVELPSNGQRRGLLTQATFLTVTSHPQRTSAVLRGKWVLEQLLCAAPPPPPPEVNPNLDNPDFSGLSLRERLELHQQQGSGCTACHAWMDPIGLGLENYDAIGAFRSEDEYGAIDASGELPGLPPVPFEGALELSTLLVQDARFERCVTQQIATYGLGERPTAQWLDALVDQADDTGVRSLKGILRALVMSGAFRTRRAGEVTP
ncbi:MAG TPA: DUF1592 domain-containing protein [Polyangiaceae bacterium]|nr:DUF1592 domain-containing protein [Polyangiaceae bacterium]